jgi:hypothetical protein
MNKEISDDGLLARQTAQKISDEVQISMKVALNEFNIEDSGFFQGEVYQLISSFLLSVSIKILEMNNISPGNIETMLQDTMDLAKDFAKVGSIKRHKDH